MKKKLSSSLPSRKFLNYQKILFLSKVMLVFLPAPIYKVKYVRDHIWVLASTRALLTKKKKKKKKKRKKKKKLAQTNSPHHYLTVGFYRIKKYCSYQKLWRFFCDSLPAPIDRKSGVRDNIYIDRRFTRGEKTGGRLVPTFFKIQQWQTTHMKHNRLACGFWNIKTFCDDVIITL